MKGTLSAQFALTFFDQCPLPALVSGATGVVLAFNDAFERLVGHDIAADLLSPPNLPNERLQALVHESGPICWKSESDGSVYLEPKDFVMNDPAHTRVRVFFDVSEQLRLQHRNTRLSETLERQTLTDPVTGLLNERGVMLALEPQVARSRRYNKSISVVAMYVAVDDASNMLLLEIARLLKDRLRWADLIGSAGEHGFILVLPETMAPAAAQLADKLQCEIDATVQLAKPGHPKCSCYGIADYRKNDTAMSLLKRAQAALQQEFNERQLDEIIAHTA
ncbi:MAG: diguanylate cyclase [Thiogranum sp.]|nr:diguanylate cyclase [Thiogranum sp.]